VFYSVLSVDVCAVSVAWWFFRLEGCLLKGARGRVSLRPDILLLPFPLFFLSASHRRLENNVSANVKINKREIEREEQHNGRDSGQAPPP
jgi:hypothetical protein